MLHRKSGMSEAYSKFIKKVKPVSDFLKETRETTGEIIDDVSQVIANTEMAQSVAKSETYKNIASLWEPESKRAEERRKQLKEIEDGQYDLMEKGQLPRVRGRKTT